MSAASQMFPDAEEGGASSSSSQPQYTGITLFDVPLGAPQKHAEPFLADNDQLSKQGPLGKFVASNRNASVAVILLLVMIGVGTVLMLGGSYFLGSVRLIAAGISYEFGSNELPHSSIRLDSGVVVERIVQPVEPVTTVYHALLLKNQLDERAHDRIELSKEDVTRGYATWQVSKNEERAHNFTFVAARELASRVLQESSTSIDSACICFAQLGLPYNIVYLASGELLFEPSIESDAWRAKVVQVRERGVLHNLLADANNADDSFSMQSDHANPPKLPVPKVGSTLVSADSGTVHYITSDGRMRRRVIDGGTLTFPCVKQCVSLFDVSIRLDGTDREKLHE